MSAAIDLFGAVYTTQGGTRYHADPACYALANGRSTQAYRAGETYLPGAGSLPGLYELRRRSTISAAQHSYTACRVCVSSEQAMQPLPLVTLSHGHEPVRGEGWFGEPETVCARCTHPGLWWGDPTYRMPVHVLWPCTSALVLGLVARGGAA